MTVELCGVHSLSFAVGLYLPIATTAPIFVGGLVRGWVDRKTRVQESDLGAGTLFSSGLIAGGSIAGILFAILVGTGAIDPFAAVGHGLPVFSRGNGACRGGQHNSVSGAGADRGPRGNAQSTMKSREASPASRPSPSLLVAASSAGTQTAVRRSTTVAAVYQFPSYFHLQNVLLHGELVESSTARLVLRGGEREIPLILNDAKGQQRLRRSARPGDRYWTARARRSARACYTRACPIRSAGRGRARSWS